MTTPGSLHVNFDPTPEIFATDAQGGFEFRLAQEGEGPLATSDYDEIRLVASIWHPSASRSIDLDRAYVEVRASFDGSNDHWFTLAELEPVVPPYGAERFDGWIVLPVFGSRTALAVSGSGFEPRARLQVRAGAYLVV